MPRRAENFWTQLITEGILDLRCDFLRLLPVICCEKCRFSLFRLVFGFVLAKRNKVQTHPPTPPSSLRILIVPVTAAKRNKRSMTRALWGDVSHSLEENILYSCFWGPGQAYIVHIVMMTKMWEIHGNMVCKTSTRTNSGPNTSLCTRNIPYSTKNNAGESLAAVSVAFGEFWYAGNYEKSLWSLPPPHSSVLRPSYGNFLQIWKFRE